MGMDLCQQSTEDECEDTEELMTALKSYGSDTSNASLVAPTPLNDGMSEIYPMGFVPPPMRIPVQAPVCTSSPETERVSTREFGLVSPPACSDVLDSASEVSRSSSSETPGVAQQILLQIPLGSICGPELAGSAAREHRVMVMNNFTEHNLQYIDFRVVLGPQGSLSSMANFNTPANSLSLAPADVSPATSPCPRPPGSLSSMAKLKTPANSLSIAAADVSPAKSPCPRPPGLWCRNGSPTTEASSFAGSKTTSNVLDKETVKLAGQPCRPIFTPARSGDLTASNASTQRGGDDTSSKSHMVCRHWKTKGWCKYQMNCKFMHPEHKRGIGAAVTEAASLPVGRFLIAQGAVLLVTFSVA